MTHFSSRFAGVVAISLLCGLTLPAKAAPTQSEVEQRLRELLGMPPAETDAPGDSGLPPPLMTRQEFQRVLELMEQPSGSTQTDSNSVPAFDPLKPPAYVPSFVFSPADTAAQPSQRMLAEIAALELLLKMNPPGPDKPGTDKPEPETPDPGQPPSDYAYYEGGERSPVPVTVRGNYTGILKGATASGLALSGAVNLAVDVAPSSADISGTFAFDGADTVQIYNLWHNNSYGLMMRSYQPFMGGNIDYTEHTETWFYGPNAEQYGGDWSFMVSGGAEPGLVSGDFVTKR